MQCNDERTKYDNIVSQDGSKLVEELVQEVEKQATHYKDTAPTMYPMSFKDKWAPLPGQLSLIFPTFPTSQSESYIGQGYRGKTAEPCISEDFHPKQNIEGIKEFFF
jgi:hypothetical protein